MRRSLIERWSRLSGLQRTLLRGSADSFLIKGSSLAVLFGLHVLLAKLLDVAEYGAYNYAMSWVNVLMVAGVLGWDTSAVKYLPQYVAEGRWDLLRGFLRRSIQVTLGATLAVAALFLLLVPRLAGKGAGAGGGLYWGAAAGVLVFVALETLLSGANRGFKRIGWALAPGQLGRPLLLAATLLVLRFVFGRRPDAAFALGIHVLTAAVSVLILALVLRRQVPPAARAVKAAYLTRRWLVVSTPMLLIASFNVLLGRLDMLMIGALTDAEHAGEYAAAAQIARLVTIGLMSVGMIAAPMFSELSSGGDTDGLRRSLRLSARVGLAISLPVFLVALLGAEQVLGVFGDGYRTAAPVLRLLACAQILNVLAGPSGYLMVMTGHQTQAAAVLGGSTVAHVVMNALLIPRLGILGAAAATTCSTLLWNGLMLGFCVRRLGLRTTPF